MTTNDQRLIELLKKQIEVEKRTLNTIAKAEDEARETAVRLAFMNMRLETWKHQKFLEGMVEMLTATPCDEWSAKAGRYAGRVMLERQFEQFMKDETDMIDLVSQAVEITDDPLAEFLLKHLHEGEKRQYDELKELIAIIKQAPLQPVKGQKGTDIACDPS